MLRNNEFKNGNPQITIGRAQTLRFARTEQIHVSKVVRENMQLSRHNTILKQHKKTKELASGYSLDFTNEGRPHTKF
jgi:hypothetical protein